MVQRHSARQLRRTGMLLQRLLLEGQFSPWFFPNHANIGCPQAFRGLLNVKLNNLSFFEGTVASPLDGGEVHENVFTAFLLDEAITLLIAEPFDPTDWHDLRPPILQVDQHTG